MGSARTTGIFIVATCVLATTTALFALLAYERNREFGYCLNLSQPGVTAVPTGDGVLDALADGLEEWIL